MCCICNAKSCHDFHRPSHTFTPHPHLHTPGYLRPCSRRCNQIAPLGCPAGHSPCGPRLPPTPFQNILFLGGSFFEASGCHPIKSHRRCAVSHPPCPGDLLSNCCQRLPEVFRNLQKTPLARRKAAAGSVKVEVSHPAAESFCAAGLLERWFELVHAGMGVPCSDVDNGMLEPMRTVHKAVGKLGKELPEGPSGALGVRGQLLLAVGRLA